MRGLMLGSGSASLADLLAGAVSDASRSGEPRCTILPEAQVARLGEVFLAFSSAQERCPFAPGDFVTPRAGHDILGAGQPHVVLEVLPPIERRRMMPRDFEESGANDAGARHDVRIGVITGDDVRVHLVESWRLERYDPETHDLPRRSDA